MAFLFPSSNNILFKYLFFSIKGLTLSLRKNLDIIKDIEADIVADIEHKIMPNIGPNNIPENKAKVTPGKAKTELPIAVIIIYIIDALIIFSFIINLKLSKLLIFSYSL